MKKILLKILVIFILGMTYSFNLSAQDNKTATGTPTVDKTVLNEATDYVTVGAIMPYYVKPFDFGSLASEMNPSIYNWSINTGTKSTEWEFYNNTTGAVLNDLGPANVGYYAVDSFNIGWNTVGNYIISVSELSQPKNSITSCDGNTETMPVQVVNRPSVLWNGATKVGACNITGLSYIIPVDLTGTDLFDVTLSCVWTKPDNTTSNILTNSNIVTGLGNIFGGSVYSTLTNQTLYTLNIPAGDYGKYVFTISTISDRISRKSGILALASDYPATTYTVIALPTPTTGKIKHVVNNFTW